MKTFTEQELSEMLDAAAMVIIRRWLSREGGGVAVYINSVIGDPNMGHRKMVSFGTSEAQIESDSPPTRLPDIGSEINWRYMLEGICRRGPDRSVPETQRSDDHAEP